MKYTISDTKVLVDVAVNPDTLEEIRTSRIVFNTICKHPKFGSQKFSYIWQGSPGLTVDDWLALPEQQQTARLNGILRPELVKHWDSLRRAAGELPPLEPEFPHLIGQEIV